MTLDELFNLVDSIQPDENGCRLFPGLKSEKDYPTASVTGDGKQSRVNRLVLSRKLKRPIKPGYHALHTCDRPNCVEATHLWEGTNLDNIKDCVAKRRHWTWTKPERRAVGDRNGSRTHPDNYPKGDKHWAHLHPEKRPKGSSHGAAILTEQQVLDIREKYSKGDVTQEYLGRIYGVGQLTISKIIRRITWKHI